MNILFPNFLKNLLELKIVNRKHALNNNNLKCANQRKGCRQQSVSVAREHPACFQSKI